jgi:hypothetical protein
MEDPCFEMPDLFLPSGFIDCVEKRGAGNCEDSVMKNDDSISLEPSRVKNPIRKIPYQPTNNFHTSKLRKAKFSIKQHIKAYLYSKHN